MAASESDLDSDKDYAFYLTMYETLELVTQNCERACNESDLTRMGIHLKMASRAMRCALEIYGDRFANTVPNEEQK